MSLYKKLKGKYKSLYTLDYVINNPALLSALFHKNRWLNYIKNKKEGLFNSLTPTLPYTLQIEPVCGCNLNCPLCPVGNKTLKRKEGHMTFDTFKRTIDQLQDSVAYIYLTNWGEPLLNKDIFKMIRYAREKNIFVSLSTNGYFLIEDKIQNILDSGLNFIRISIDGASQETYLNYREGSDFEKVKNNLQRLVLDRGNKKYPFIEMQFIIMKHNEHEIPKIKQLAKQLGVDKLSLKTLLIYKKDDIGKYLPTKKEYRRYTITQGTAEPKKRKKCYLPWLQMVVNWNGDISVCCVDYDVNLKMGNINEQTAKEIWHSTKYVAFRKQILKDPSKIKICSTCSAIQQRFIED